MREIAHPSVQTMFDTHNAVAEELPHDQLIKQHASLIRHVHINEMDGRHPGTGSYDFSIPMQALRDIGYGGWLSLEVFKFEPSGEEIARISSQYLRDIESSASYHLRPRDRQVPGSQLRRRWHGTESEDRPRGAGARSRPTARRARVPTGP